MSIKQIILLSPNTPRIVTPKENVENNMKTGDESDVSEDLIDLPTIGESIVFEIHSLERLRIMVNQSKIAHIGKLNELQDSAAYHWGQLMESMGLAEYATMEEWVIIRRLFSGESSLTSSQIMAFPTVNTFQPMMGSLYEDIGYEFYSFFRKSAILPNIPEYLKSLRLDRVYEQIVFYEYIYSSSIYSLYHKLRWIIDNEYVELIDLINEHHLDLWDRRRDYTDIEEYVLLGFEYQNYRDGNDYYDNLQSLLDVHSQILSFNVSDYLTMSRESVSRESVSRESVSISILRIASKYWKHPDPSQLISSLQPNLRRIARISGKTSRELDDTPMISIYSDYVAIDMLMDIIVRGYDIGLTDVAKANIIYEWLVYSSRILSSSNGRYAVVAKSNGELVISRYLLRSYSRDIEIHNLTSALKLVNIDFESMLYVYLKDNVDIFRTITRNCDFQTLDPTVVSYYPTRILNYISDRTGRSLQNLLRSIRGDLVIDIHLLLDLDLSRLSNLANIAFKNVFADEIYSTKRKVCVANLLSNRIDPMNEDILCLHELNELHQLGSLSETTLSNVLETLFFENTQKSEASRFFDRTSNFPILGVLSYAYLKSINPDSSPLRNYTSYLTSLEDFDRVAPSIIDIYESMMFMRYHSRYLDGFKEYINLRNEMVREYLNGGNWTKRYLWELMDDVMEISPNPRRYGIYLSDSDTSESDAEGDECGELSDSEIDSDEEISLYAQTGY
jgi:hypothetical protein